MPPLRRTSEGPCHARGVGGGARRTWTRAGAMAADWVRANIVTVVGFCFSAVRCGEAVEREEREGIWSAKLFLYVRYRCLKEGRRWEENGTIARSHFPFSFRIKAIRRKKWGKKKEGNRMLATDGRLTKPVMYLPRAWRRTEGDSSRIRTRATKSDPCPCGRQGGGWGRWITAQLLHDFIFFSPKPSKNDPKKEKTIIV